MEMLEKLSSEVLIYVQNVRKYFTSNDETREYFGINTHEDEFFDGVITQAQKNYEETGDPELSTDQFEDVRSNTSKRPEMRGVFISFGIFGMISLN